MADRCIPIVLSVVNKVFPLEVHFWVRPVGGSDADRQVQTCLRICLACRERLQIPTGLRKEGEIGRVGGRERGRERNIYLSVSWIQRGAVF